MLAPSAGVPDGFVEAAPDGSVDALPDGFVDGLASGAFGTSLGPHFLK